MLREFKLPDVGEGLTEAEIVKWHVAPGDAVKVNQTIVEIETAKAVVELPCPYEGTVSALLVDEGQTVDVGTPIISVEDGESGDGAATGHAAADTKPDARNGAPAKEERQPVLVGYGVKAGATRRRPRKPAAPSPVTHAGPGRSATAPGGPSAPASAPPVAPVAPVPPVSTAPAAAPVAPAPAGAAPGNGSSASARARVLAKPPVRKLAKDLGVDLATLTGTGPQGSITRADVEAAVAAPAAPAAVRREERIPVRGVRKATAQAMVASAFSAPHVTEWLQVDVTETMEAVRRLRTLPEFAEVKVSPLLLVAKALITAVKRHPMINATWTGEEIVVKHYVNLGIAAATDRGLIVPNVKDADAMSLAELARALGELTERARAGKCQPAELSGGTITITNVGVFGVDAGTPILNPGEVAILAVGQIRDMPWVVDGQLAVRKVTTLALSFDHRVVDGELGSYVLRDVGAMLEDPLRMLAWG
ncbi:dihydrolipoamide acetyltransferase component of pyruvate dehydrogenase complex [Microbispora rosea subsp. aerata]|nr:dihydrolipoamide acetyltransferase family protein [Microbispora rosea]GGO16399.1 dihydrolipoamide acetyltransferase component of pyruvate dehydrogenase complex [Microbispora rosea subsp. aerata]GIH55914.1 dihydrolipoamide acetyltransferase component of pyruvate dehydrogenase complex [Microbispora rosea subsp. aerata]GLJ83172.1 dihydrolipoamide acetyltransferase component of pyruvate dehydrogenase complex [Microbispora rosea subsp. aerata]